MKNSEKIVSIYHIKRSDINVYGFENGQNIFSPALKEFLKDLKNHKIEFTYTMESNGIFYFNLYFLDIKTNKKINIAFGDWLAKFKNDNGDITYRQLYLKVNNTIKTIDSFLDRLDTQNEEASLVVTTEVSDETNITPFLIKYKIN